MSEIQRNLGILEDITTTTGAVAAVISSALETAAASDNSREEEPRHLASSTTTGSTQQTHPDKSNTIKLDSEYKETLSFPLGSGDRKSILSEFVGDKEVQNHKCFENTHSLLVTTNDQVYEDLNKCDAGQGEQYHGEGGGAIGQGDVGRVPLEDTRLRREDCDHLSKSGRSDGNHVSEIHETSCPSSPFLSMANKGSDFSVSTSNSHRSGRIIRDKSDNRETFQVSHCSEKSTDEYDCGRHGRDKPNDRISLSPSHHKSGSIYECGSNTSNPSRIFQPSSKIIELPEKSSRLHEHHHHHHHYRSKESKIPVGIAVAWQRLVTSTPTNPTVSPAMTTKAESEPNPIALASSPLKNMSGPCALEQSGLEASFGNHPSRPSSASPLSSKAAKAGNSATGGGVSGGGKVNHHHQQRSHQNHHTSSPSTSSTLTSSNNPAYANQTSSADNIHTQNAPGRNNKNGQLALGGESSDITSGSHKSSNMSNIGRPQSACGEANQCASDSGSARGLVPFCPSSASPLSRPMPSSSVPPHMGFPTSSSYQYPQRNSYLDYTYGVNSAGGGDNRTFAVPSPLTSPHHPHHPTLHNNGHYWAGVENSSVPMLSPGMPSAGAPDYLQLSIQQQMLLHQQHLLASRQGSMSLSPSPTSSSSYNPYLQFLYSHQDPSSVTKNPYYDHFLHQNELLRQQEHQMLLSHHHHQAYQHMSQSQQSVTGNMSGSVNGNNSSSGSNASVSGFDLLANSASAPSNSHHHRAIPMQVASTRTSIPLLSPSPTGGIRTPTPTSSSSSTAGATTTGDVIAAPELAASATTTATTRSHASAAMSQQQSPHLHGNDQAAGWPSVSNGTSGGIDLVYSSSSASSPSPSFLLLHHQQHPHLFTSSSAALSPKSLTSSTPSPVTVHDFNSGLNVVVSSTNTTMATANVTTTNAMLAARKCSTPSPISLTPRGLLSPFGSPFSPSPVPTHTANNNNQTNGNYKDLVWKEDKIRPMLMARAHSEEEKHDSPSDLFRLNGHREKDGGDMLTTTPTSSPLLRRKQMSVPTPLSSPSQKHDFKRLESLIERRDSESISPLVLIPQHSPASTTSSTGDKCMTIDDIVTAAVNERIENDFLHKQRQVVPAFQIKMEPQKDDVDESEDEMITMRLNVDKLPLTSESISQQPSAFEALKTENVTAFEENMVKEKGESGADSSLNISTLATQCISNDNDMVVKVKAEKESGENEVKDNEENKASNQTLVESCTNSSSQSCDDVNSSGCVANISSDDKTMTDAKVDENSHNECPNEIEKNRVPESTLPSVNNNYVNEKSTSFTELIASEHVQLTQNSAKEVSFTSGYSSSHDTSIPSGEEVSYCEFSKGSKTNVKPTKEKSRKKPPKSLTIPLKPKKEPKMTKASPRCQPLSFKRADKKAKKDINDNGEKQNKSKKDNTQMKNFQNVLTESLAVKAKKVEPKKGKQKEAANNIELQLSATGSKRGVAKPDLLSTDKKPRKNSTNLTDNGTKKNIDKEQKVFKTAVDGESKLSDSLKPKRQYRKDPSKPPKGKKKDPLSSDAGILQQHYQLSHQGINNQGITLNNLNSYNVPLNKSSFSVTPQWSTVNTSNSNNSFSNETRGVILSSSIVTSERGTGSDITRLDKSLAMPSIIGGITYQSGSTSVNNTSSLINTTPVSVIPPKQGVSLILHPSYSTTHASQPISSSVSCPSQVTFLITSPKLPCSSISTKPDNTLKIPAYIPRSMTNITTHDAQSPLTPTFITSSGQPANFTLMDESYSGPATLTLHRDVDATQPQQNFCQPPAITIQYHHSAPATPALDPALLSPYGIKPEENHLDLLATVAQEFGSREDLGKRLSIDGSCGSSLIGESPPMSPQKSPYSSMIHLPQNSMFSPTAPVPSSVVYNAHVNNANAGSKIQESAPKIIAPVGGADSKLGGQVPLQRKTTPKTPQTKPKKVKLEKTSNSISKPKRAGKKQKRSVSDSASYAPPVVLLKIPQIIPKRPVLAQLAEKRKKRAPNTTADKESKALLKLEKSVLKQLEKDEKKREKKLQKEAEKLTKAKSAPKRVAIQKELKANKTGEKREEKKKSTIQSGKTNLAGFSSSAASTPAVFPLQLHIPTLPTSGCSPGGIPTPALTPTKSPLKEKVSMCSGVATLYSSPERISAFAKQAFARRDSSVLGTSPTMQLVSSEESPTKFSKSPAFFSSSTPSLTTDKVEFKHEDSKPTFKMSHLTPFHDLPLGTSRKHSDPPKPVTLSVPKVENPPTPPPTSNFTNLSIASAAGSCDRECDPTFFEQDTKKTDVTLDRSPASNSSISTSNFKRNGQVKPTVEKKKKLKAPPLTLSPVKTKKDKSVQGAAKKDIKTYSRNKSTDGPPIKTQKTSCESRRKSYPASELKESPPPPTLVPYSPIGSKQSRLSTAINVSPVSSDFNPLTPPPTAKFDKHKGKSDIHHEFPENIPSPASSSSASSTSQSSPSNTENEGEIETENENDYSNWVADPTFAVSAIKLSESSHPSDNSSIGEDSSVSSDTAQVGNLRKPKATKRHRTKSEKPPKLSLLNVPNKPSANAVNSSNGENQQERNRFVGLKSELKAFADYKPRQVTGGKGSASRHYHVKPSLKAEPVVRSHLDEDDEDNEEEHQQNEDFELDLEVANITTHNTPRSGTPQHEYRKTSEGGASGGKLSSSSSLTATSSTSAGKKPSINRNRLSYLSNSSSKAHLSTIEIMKKVFSRKISPELYDNAGTKERRHKKATSSNATATLPSHDKELEADDENEEDELLDIDTPRRPKLPIHPAVSMNAAAVAVVVNMSSSSTPTSTITHSGKKSPKKRTARSSTTSSSASATTGERTQRTPGSSTRGNRGHGACTSGTSAIATSSGGKRDETLLPGRVELASVDELVDQMRILTEIQGLFYTGRLNALQPPDVYGVTLDNERGAPPHIIFSAEEVLEKCLREKKPQSLSSGLRICAYWSPQYSGLYPGRVSSDFNPKFDPEKDLIPIEFDDGDTGMIKLKEIRRLSINHPVREYDPNPLLTLEKKHRKRRYSSATATSGGCTGDHDEPDCGEPYCAKMGKLEEEDDDDDDDGDGDQCASSGGHHSSSKMLYWTWSGLGYKCKRAKNKKARNKEFFRGIQRGNEVINVGDAALFISTGNERPFIGRVERFWEKKGKKMVNVRWFYHPEEVKASAKRLSNLKYPGALFESPHIDENDVQTIAKKCDVLPFADFKSRYCATSGGSLRLAKLSKKSSSKPRDMYYVAGFYDPYTYNLTLKNLK